MEEQIIEKNKKYWDDHADLWFGTTALPKYGVKFATEDDLHFFSEVEGKKVLEICCGSGHSLKYLADKGAEELWGLDLSQKQLDNAGFIIEKMIEQTDEKSLADTEDNSPKAQKAKMVPLSMCFKCRKL